VQSKKQNEVLNNRIMKKYAKNLKEYYKIDFKSKEIILGMSRLKEGRRKPTSFTLEENLMKELTEDKK
jgi:hypothetical protein